MTRVQAPAIPAEFVGIGYTESRDGFPLEAMPVGKVGVIVDQTLAKSV